MVSDMIVRMAARNAIAECKKRLSETQNTFVSTDWLAMRSMYVDCVKAAEGISSALSNAQVSLTTAEYIDNWLSEQPEWLQWEIRNHVMKWIEKTFGE
jgi:hypothetical protein